MLGFKRPIEGLGGFWGKGWRGYLKGGLRGTTFVREGVVGGRRRKRRRRRRGDREGVVVVIVFVGY